MWLGEWRSPPAVPAPVLACRALLALEESKGETEPQDPYDWQELAQIWLAERADFEGGLCRCSLLIADMAVTCRRPVHHQVAISWLLGMPRSGND